MRCKMPAVRVCVARCMHGVLPGACLHRCAQGSLATWQGTLMARKMQGHPCLQACHVPAAVRNVLINVFAGVEFARYMACACRGGGTLRSSGGAVNGGTSLTRGQLDKAVLELERSIKDTEKEVGASIHVRARVCVRAPACIPVHANLHAILCVHAACVGACGAAWTAQKVEVERQECTCAYVRHVRACA